MALTMCGNVVQAGDDIVILGIVTAISGSGQTASVTVKDRSGIVFTVLASDCAAPQAIGAAISRNGKPFGVGSEVTIPGSVVSVVENGSSLAATLTTKTTSSISVVNAAVSTAAPKRK
jgi:hypothetical protein